MCSGSLKLGFKYLKLDRGVSSEDPLAATSVIGPLDPGDDGDAQILSRLPTLAIEHVLLEQREEGLHGRVVTAGADPAHRSGEAVVLEGADEGLGSKLRSAVGMNYHGVDRMAECNGVAQSRDGQRCGHSIGQAVADDAIRVDVLDGTAVELSLVGPVLCDVGEPQRIGPVC